MQLVADCAGVKSNDVMLTDYTRFYTLFYGSVRVLLRPRSAFSVQAISVCAIQVQSPGREESDGV